MTATPSARQRQHLAFLFAVEEVQVILHRRETRPPMQFRDIEGAGELPGGHVAGADVARLAGFHHVVQASMVSSIGVIGSLRWIW
jgi:hypothetical protein